MNENATEIKRLRNSSWFTYNDLGFYTKGREFVEKEADHNEEKNSI